MTNENIYFTVKREDWTSEYVDDPLLTEVTRIDDFEVAKKIYDEQKKITNSRILDYEVSILIYYNDVDVAYISDKGEMRSLDYLDTYDISLEEIKKIIKFPI